MKCSRSAPCVCALDCVTKCSFVVFQRLQSFFGPPSPLGCSSFFRPFLFVLSQSYLTVDGCVTALTASFLQRLPRSVSSTPSRPCTGFSHTVIRCPWDVSVRNLSTAMPVGLSETFPSSTCYRLLALLVLDAPDLCCDGNQLNQVRSLPFDVSCAAFLTPPSPGLFRSYRSPV